MKLSIVTSIFLVGYSSAFTVTSPNAISLQKSLVSSSSTSINLFGGKKGDASKGDGAKPAGGMGGMMDQLAMFKKAQEIATKKKAIDDELAKEDIIGEAADGNVKVTVKYVPAQMPTSPLPSYDTVSVNLDSKYLDEVSSPDLSEALVVAIRDGEKKAAAAAAEKYKTLDAEIGAILGGMAGGAAPQ